MPNEDQSDLFVALAKAQLEIKPPVKDKINPRFKSKYVSLDAVLDAVRETLAKHGLIIQCSVEYREEKPLLRASLYHVNGEVIETFVPMFLAGMTSQDFGSALTYARRYAICSLLSLPSDEDDDANAATDATKVEEKLSTKQAYSIMEIVKDNDDLLTRILKGYKVEKIQDIDAKHYDVIMNALNKSGTKK